jgi:hypothetical protein
MNRQNWKPDNRRGHVKRTWAVRVLVAALALDRDFVPAELDTPSPVTTAEAVSMLVQNGYLDWIRGAGACTWKYRLTAKGRARAELHADPVAAKSTSQPA